MRPEVQTDQSSESYKFSRDSCEELFPSPCDYSVSCDERHLLFEHCSWRTACAGDILDTKLKEERRVRNRDVELISSPFIYCISQRTFTIVFICISVFILSSGFHAISVLLDGLYPLIQIDSVKIVWSKGTPPIESAKLNFSTKCDDEQHGYHGYSNLGRPVVILGFTMAMNATGKCHNYSSHFTLQGSNDNGKTFIAFGSSRIRWTLRGIRLVDQGIKGCPNEFSVDFQPPWPWYTSEESILFLLISGASLSAAAVCAALHQHRAARNFVTGSLLVMALLMLLSCLGFLSLGFYAEAFHPAVCFCCFVTLAYSLVCSERYFVEYFTTVSASLLTARFVNDLIIFGDGSYITSWPPAAQAATTLMGSFFLARKQRLISRIMHGATSTWDTYDKAWGSLVGKMENRQAFGRLDWLARRACLVSGKAHPHQYNRARDTSVSLVHTNTQSWRTKLNSRFDSSFGKHGSLIFSGKIGPEAATFEVPPTVPGTAKGQVVSMCQLYSQALCVAPILYSACSDWANKAKGSLYRHTAVPDITSHPSFPVTLQRWIAKGIVKSPSRAIAKVLACYDGDVSCLLDICRCRIIFDCVADMAKCVEMVAGLDQIRIVRVKNGMSEAHDAALSGGFRAVVLNLRFDSDFTRRLGLENHVCEVQLVHAAFAAVVKAGSHRQYTDFRDLRGFIRPIFPAPRQVTVRSESSGAKSSTLIPATSNTLSISHDVEHRDAADNSSEAGNVAEKEKRIKEALLAGYDVQNPVETVSRSEDSECTFVQPLGEEQRFKTEICKFQGPDTVSALETAVAIRADSADFQDIHPKICPHENTLPLPECHVEGARIAFRNPRVNFDRSNTHSSLKASIQAAAYSIYLRFTLGESGSLDRHASNFENALQKSSSYSVLFSSKPYAAYAAKPMGKIRTLLLLLVWLFYASAYTWNAFYSGKGQLKHSQLRLRTVNLPGLGSSSNISSIETFGLRYGECSIQSVKRSESGFIIENVDEYANGYYFVLSDVSLQVANQLVWSLEASNDNGKQWSPVGRCSWVTLRTSIDDGKTSSMLWWPSSWHVDCADGSINLASYVTLTTPLPRGTHILVDFGQEKEFKWLAVGFWVVPIGWLCGLLVALFGNVKFFKSTLVITLTGWGMWNLFWQIEIWKGGVGFKRGFYLWIMWCSAPAIWSSVGFQFFERKLVFIFLIDGILFLIDFIILSSIIYRNGLYSAFIIDLPCSMTLVLGLYLALGSVVFYWMRHKVLCRAQNLVCIHQSQYDQVWVEIMRSQESDCIALRTQLCKIINKLKLGGPTQSTRSNVESNGSNGVIKSLYWRVIYMLNLSTSNLAHSAVVLPVSDEVELDLSGLGAGDKKFIPIFSLDQLFVQATCAYPILLRKVQLWALQCDGMFPCRNSNGGPVLFVKYSAEHQNPDLHFKWCALKRVPRAVEKVIRSYGLDISRLVDVCRQSIVFERIQNISRFMNVLESDHDVEILRIKNRLDPGYKSAASGGYRDVNINLRFLSPLAMQLGIDRHVCELQLILHEIAILKNDDGHRNYVEGRNLKAE